MKESNLEEIKQESEQKIVEMTKKAGRGRPKKDQSLKEKVGNNNNGGERVSSLKNTYEAIFSFFGKVLAVLVDYKKFELTDNENKMLSEQADDVTQEFFPQIPSKWLKLTVFLASLIGVFGKKYLDFAKEEQDKKKIKPVKEEQEKIEVNEIVEIKNKPFYVE